MLAVDISNYTSPLTPDTIASWRAAGVGLVIAQAFPSTYYQYAEQVQQMRLCSDEGMPLDNYTWDYLNDPSWVTNTIAGLNRIFDDHGVKPRQLWLDEEDIQTEVGWSPQQRIDAIARSVEKLQSWALGDGATRIYTADWYWRPKTANTTRFSYAELWDADYDGKADAGYGWVPYGGWTERRIKQYAGDATLSGVTGIDLNALSVEEANELTADPPIEPSPPNFPVDWAWLEKKDLVVSTLGLIEGDKVDRLLAEAARPAGPRRSEIRMNAYVIRELCGDALA